MQTQMHTQHKARIGNCKTIGTDHKCEKFKLSLGLVQEAITWALDYKVMKRRALATIAMCFAPQKNRSVCRPESSNQSGPMAGAEFADGGHEKSHPCCFFCPRITRRLGSNMLCQWMLMSIILFSDCQEPGNSPAQLASKGLGPKLVDMVAQCRASNRRERSVVQQHKNTTARNTKHVWHICLGVQCSVKIDLNAVKGRQMRLFQGENFDPGCRTIAVAANFETLWCFLQKASTRYETAFDFSVSWATNMNCWLGLFKVMFFPDRPLWFWLIFWCLFKANPRYDVFWHKFGSKHRRKLFFA